MRTFLVFFSPLLFGLQAYAQDLPTEGATISGTVSVGRSTFALPPGQWHVASARLTKTDLAPVFRTP